MKLGDWGNLCIAMGAGLIMSALMDHSVKHRQSVKIELPAPPAPVPTVGPMKLAGVMREARIQCLAAILVKTPTKNWPGIKRDLVNSPNICLIAMYLWPKDVPDTLPAEPTREATEAVDHG